MTSLRKQVSDALRADGYRILDKSVHLLRLDEDFSLWVSTGVIGLATDIAPHVGLRSEVVERTSSELMALKNYPSTATIGANVGYVLDGSYRAWQPGSDVTEILETIGSSLKTLIPFASLAKLPDALNLEGVRQSPGTPYVAVVVAALRNDSAAVEECLARARRSFCSESSPPDPVCEQFLEFQQRVRDRFGSAA